MSEQVISISTLSFPSRDKIFPLKLISPFLIFANALIGVEHPPNNVLKKSLSIFTQVAVSASLKFEQASKQNLSSARHTTMMAPWAGAGNIQSSSIEFLGRRFILSKPAAANTAPFQLLSSTFFSL